MAPSLDSKLLKAGGSGSFFSRAVTFRAPSPPRAVDDALTSAANAVEQAANAAAQTVEQAANAAAQTVEQAARTAESAIDSAANATLNASHLKDATSAFDDQAAAMLPGYAGGRSGSVEGQAGAGVSEASRKASLADAMVARMPAAAAALLNGRTNFARRASMVYEMDGDGKLGKKMSSTNYIVTDERDKLAATKAQTDDLGIRKLKRAQTTKFTGQLESFAARHSSVSLEKRSSSKPSSSGRSSAEETDSSKRSSHGSSAVGVDDAQGQRPAPPPSSEGAKEPDRQTGHHAPGHNMPDHDRPVSPISEGYGGKDYNAFSAEDVARVLPVLREVPLLLHLSDEGLLALLERSALRDFRKGVNHATQPRSLGTQRQSPPLAPAPLHNRPPFIPSPSPSSPLLSIHTFR